MAGVPSIFGLDALAGGPNILTRDLATYGIIAPQWGIFDSNGASVVKADNVETFDFKSDYTISDYPLERGAFESYDKVQVPFEARIRFTAGGNFSNRQALINSIQAISGDLKRYDVVTPEKTWLSVNVIHYDLMRTATNGAGLIRVDVWVQQVRVTAQTTIVSTAAPSGAAPVDGGQVQPQTPTTAQIAVANKAIADGA